MNADRQRAGQLANSIMSQSEFRAPRAARALICASIAGVLLAFPFAILSVTSLSFALDSQLSWFHLPLAFVLTAAFGTWSMRAVFRHEWKRPLLVALGVTALAAAASGGLAGSVHDTSWDGQTYHALAITRMAQGWNPVRTAVPAVPSYENELNYFAKGPWQLAASIYRFTGNYESGKGIHLYLMLAAYLFWVAALLTFRGIRALWCLAAALPLALNPVSGAQAFTYYVDGQLASLLGIVLALLIVTWRARTAPLYVALAMAVALAIDTKLTGALYLLVIGGGFWIWHLLSRRNGARALSAWLVIGAVTGIAITGYNPYVSQFAVQTITTGNPFHPHPHWSSIINLESRSSFPGRGRVDRLVRSLLAPSLIWSDEGAGYKLPFTFSGAELKEFAAPDVRYGGFGPLFSGALLLTAATVILLLTRRRRAGPFLHLVVLAGLVLISVLSFSEAWWPRLAPQLAFVPPLLGIVGLLVLRRRTQRAVPGALLAVLTLNSLLVLAAHTYLAIDRSVESQRQLDGLRASRTAITVRGLDEFPGLRHRLQEAGIVHHDVESLPCPEEHREQLGYVELYACRVADRRLTPQ